MFIIEIRFEIEQRGEVKQLDGNGERKTPKHIPMQSLSLRKKNNTI